MSKLLTAEEIISMIEAESQQRIWNICAVGKGEIIENTEFYEIRIYVTMNEHDVVWLDELFKNVLNILDIQYTGVPKAGM